VVISQIQRALSGSGGRSTRVGAFLLFAGLLAIYLATASPGEYTRAEIRSPTPLPAWRLVTAGTLAVTGYEAPWLSLDEYGEGLFRWYVVNDGRSYSRYPPGAAAVGVPFVGLAALVSSDLRLEFAPWPAAIAASVTAAAAVALFFLLMSRVVEPGTALGAALVAGLASPVWAVSADALWRHAPAQPWLVRHARDGRRTAQPLVPRLRSGCAHPTDGGSGGRTSRTRSAGRTPR
jgi:hypothetical protein